jgi:chemotaxis protein MotA
MTPMPRLELTLPARAARTRFDAAAVTGFIAGFAMLAVAIGFGGSVAAFIDLPAVLIVIGGTVSAVSVCYSVRDVADAVRGVRAALFGRSTDPQVMALQLIEIAEYARQYGILALQSLEHPLAGSAFLEKAVALVVDGAGDAEMADIMQGELQADYEGRRHAAAVLRKAAELAPAMGLIGTLIGLVQMLRELADPSAIGPGMAVALLTTFYGATLGHMVFAPLAAKLEGRGAEEALLNQLAILCAASVARQENPRRLETAINSVLPPSRRIAVFR